MSDSTTQHDHPADPGLNPFFREPAMAETWGQLQDGKAKMDAAYARVEALVPPDMVAARDQLAADVAAAEPPAAPAGPEPLLEGTFAIYVTPQEALVVAYRPLGAPADKQFVVPAFLIAMATQRTGHSLADVVKGLKEQGE